MQCHDEITQMILTAIGEMNQMREPDNALEVSADLVLIGEGVRLDSLGFVNLGTELVDGIEAAFKKPLDLTDILAAAQHNPCTVATLARELADRLNGAAEAKRGE